MNRGGAPSHPDLLLNSSGLPAQLTVNLLQGLPTSTLPHLALVPFSYYAASASFSRFSLRPPSFSQTSVKSSGTSMIVIGAKRTPPPCPD